MLSSTTRTCWHWLYSQIRDLMFNYNWRWSRTKPNLLSFKDLHYNYAIRRCYQGNYYHNHFMHDNNARVSITLTNEHDIQRLYHHQTFRDQSFRDCLSKQRLLFWNATWTHRNLRSWIALRVLHLNYSSRSSNWRRDQRIHLMYRSTSWANPYSRN